MGVKSTSPHGIFLNLLPALNALLRGEGGEFIQLVAELVSSEPSARVICGSRGVAVVSGSARA